eukprot:5488004-Ditylum_brightwellii.AAC.1
MKQQWTIHNSQESVQPTACATDKLKSQRKHKHIGTVSNFIRSDAPTKTCNTQHAAILAFAHPSAPFDIFFCSPFELVMGFTPNTSEMVEHDIMHAQSQSHCCFNAIALDLSDIVLLTIQKPPT